MTGSSNSIAWLLTDLDLPSNRIRCALLQRRLEERGLAGDIYRLPRRNREFSEIADKLAASDVVVVRKNLPRGGVIRRIAQNSRRLVYDVDDAIWFRTSHAARAGRLARTTLRFWRMMREADIVIVGNRFLGDEARKFGGRRIFELPSAVPVDVPQKQETGSPLTLGWIGTAVNLPFLNAMEPIFLELEKSGLDFELRVVSDYGPTFERFSRYRFVRWQKDTQEAEIAAFDIGLMPLSDNPFTRGKGAYKALQYLAASVPAVASDVGVTAEFLGPGAIIAADGRAFYDGIRKLATEPSLRRDMGAIGRARMVKFFSVEVIGDRLAAILAGKQVETRYDIAH